MGIQKDLRRRVVHMELATSLSTDDLFFKFAGLIARRDRSSIIYNDNVIKIVGANNAWKKCMWIER